MRLSTIAAAVLLLASPQSSYAAPIGYGWDTGTGGDPTIYEIDFGTGAITALHEPGAIAPGTTFWGMTWDASGNRIVAHSGTNVIALDFATLTDLNSATNPLSTLFSSPAIFSINAVETHPSTDDIYGQSEGNGNLYRFNFTTSQLDLVQTFAGYHPSALAIHPASGEFYGMDYGDPMLYRLDLLAGTLTPVFDTGFAQVIALDFDGTGTLYASADPGGRIVKIDLAIPTATLLHSGLPRLDDLTIPDDEASASRLPAPPYTSGGFVPGVAAYQKTGSKLATGLRKYRDRLAACYQAGVTNVFLGKPNGVDGCVNGARAEYDRSYQKLLVQGVEYCIDLDGIAEAVATEMQALNATVFCAGGTSLPQPFGGGSVPPTGAALRAELAAHKLFAKAAGAALKCLDKGVKGLFKVGDDQGAIDEVLSGIESCTAKASSKYTTSAAKVVKDPTVLACLDTAALGTAAAAVGSQTSAELYCTNAAGLTDQQIMTTSDGRLHFDISTFEENDGARRRLIVRTSTFDWIEYRIDDDGNDLTLTVLDEHGTPLRAPAAATFLLANLDQQEMDSAGDAQILRGSANTELLTLGLASFVTRHAQKLSAAAELQSLDLGEIFNKLQVVPYVDPSPVTDNWDDQCYKKDFECSSVAPNDIEVSYLKWVRPEGKIIPRLVKRTAVISFLECCLRHDVDFYCGGTAADFVHANAVLVDCVTDQIAASDLPPVQKLAQLAWWSLVFSGTFIPYASDDSETGMGWCSSDGSDWNSPGESETCERRQQSCLCGGNEPAPLCDSPCEINDCSLPVPERYERSAWQDMCVDECHWVCLGGGVWGRGECQTRGDGQDFDCAPSTCTPADPQPSPSECP